MVVFSLKCLLFENKLIILLGNGGGMNKCPWIHFDQAEKSENLNTSHFKLSIKNIHVQNNIILSFNL